MVDKRILELAKLMNSAIVTPYNLLENICLDNYVSMNFFKENESLLSDVTFSVNKRTIIYRYVFDLNNNLQKIYDLSSGDNDILFNRSEEKKALIDSINKSSINYSKASSI